jgi:hypothetical protein
MKGIMKMVSFIIRVASQTRLRAFTTACATRLLPLLSLLTLPGVVQAQFLFLTNNGVITITKYTGSGGAVTIPSMTNGYPVACIQGYALSNCPFTSVSIPGSVTNIGEGAFATCPFLTNVTLPDSLTSIAGSLFARCTSLANITLPRSATSIGLYAFAICNSLTNITIPANVTNLGQYAFQSCASLRSVYFQGNAPSAYPNVFHADANLTVYYLSGTTGWDKWVSPPPAVLWDPLMRANGPSFGVRTNQFGLNITSTTNIPLPIVVETSTNLISASWTALQTCTLTNGSIYFSDAAWTNYPCRFYRIRSP